MIKVFRETDFKTMPWKNGLGVTLELYKKTSAKYEFSLRLSRAKVTSNGPFSKFPNHSRALILLSGNGINIKTGDKEEVKLDKNYVPFMFSGEAQTHANLIDGEIEDFNVIWATSENKTQVTVIDHRGEVSIKKNLNEIILLYIHKGHVKIDDKTIEAESVVVIEDNSTHVKSIIFDNSGTTFLIKSQKINIQRID